MKRNAQGFTLIELLIVIAIIAILALIAIPNFLEAQTRAKIAQAKSNMRTLAVAIEAFHVDNNLYLAAWGGAGTTANYVMDIGDPMWSIPNITNPQGYPRASLTSPIAYITSIVKDPFMMAGAYQASAVPAPGWSRYEDFAWMYGVDVTCSSYWMLASLGPDRKGNSPSAGGGYPAGTPPGTTAVGAVPNCFLSLLITDGPDLTRRYFYVGGTNVNTGAQYNGQYDPTNGTISAGDIYRSNIGDSKN